MRLIDFDRDGEPYATFAKTIDLLGDGTVRLISTPGHTDVAQRVGGVSDHEDPPIPGHPQQHGHVSDREEILPLLTADDEASVRSVREIRTFSEGEPEAILGPSHDPSAWHELRRGVAKP